MGATRKESLFMQSSLKLLVAEWVQIWPITDPKLSFADTSPNNNLSFIFSVLRHLIGVH